MLSASIHKICNIYIYIIYTSKAYGSQENKIAHKGMAKLNKIYMYTKTLYVLR